MPYILQSVLDSINRFIRSPKLPVAKGMAMSPSFPISIRVYVRVWKGGCRCGQCSSAGLPPAAVLLYIRQHLRQWFSRFSVNGML